MMGFCEDTYAACLVTRDNGPRWGRCDSTIAPGRWVEIADPGLEHLPAGHPWRVPRVWGLETRYVLTDRCSRGSSANTRTGTGG